MKRLVSPILIFLIVLPAFAVFTPKARASEDVIFQDDFESYAVGTFPSTGGWELVWNGMGTEYQVITDAYCVSPTKSLQLWGNPNDWSAVVQKHFSSTSRFLGYEVSMMVSAVGYGGPGRSDYVGFFCKEAYVWGKHYAAILFNHDTMNILTDDNNVVGTWTPGVWYNIKVLLDRNTNTYSAWIDGQLKGTSFHTPNTDTNLIDAVQLQSDHPGVKDYFDDVRVFEASSATAGLIAHWKFDEGSGSVAFDSSGNNYDGAVNGAAWITGVSDGALYFDGSDYVAVPDNPSLSGFTQLTLEAWIKADRFDSYLKGIVNKGNGGGYFGDEYGLQLNYDRIRLILSAGDPTGWIVVADTDPVISLNQWFHVAGAWDSSHCYIYVNGELAHSSQTIVSGAVTHDTSNSLNIGSIGADSWPFNGAIDEVKIYDHARTAEDIRADYAQYEGLVAHWTLDEGLGNIASDSSGNGNTGTVNGAAWVDGIKGKALEFDGINDFVSIPHSSSLDIAGNEISVEYWMKLPSGWYAGSGSYDQILYDKGDAYTACMVAANGRHRFNIPYLPPYPETNKNAWDADVWYHIADVFDGNQIRIYVNGVLDRTETVVGPVSRSGLDLAIGSHCFGDSNFFNGHLDDFAIYNYARTAEEIQNDYNSVSPPVGEKPVAILHLDDTVHNIGADVWFYGDQSYDPDGGRITSYIFDFDDQTPNMQVYWPQIGTTHQYNAPGEYWPRMKVIDDEGTESDWTTVELTILPAPSSPTAILIVTPNPQKVGDPVTFDASQSTDPDGISDYGFEFGDGTQIMWTGDPIATHSFSQVGEYYARVIVVDNSGLETWSVKTKVKITSEPPAPLRVTIQSNPPIRLGTIPFVATFTAIPSGGKGSYSISWQITSSIGGTWSSTQNPLTYNFKYSDTYVVEATATCSGSPEVATAQTTVIATGTLYEVKFNLWSGDVQGGTNNPLVALEYNNQKNLGYFTVSGSSVSLKTNVRVSFNGATVPDWLSSLLGISSPWYSIRISDTAGTVDAVPLAQLSGGTATPIDVTLPTGTPTTIVPVSYLYRFTASPTTSRAIAADVVSAFFAVMDLRIGGAETIVHKIFEAAVTHLDETAAQTLTQLPLMSTSDQLSFLIHVRDDILTPGYLLSLATSVIGSVGRDLIQVALHKFPYITLAIVLSDLGLFLGAISRGDIWDEYYVSQVTPMLYMCIDPPEIINAVLNTPDGAVGYHDGVWENEGTLSGFYHTEILNNTYGFGIPITAAGYCADLTLSSASGNSIPFRITVNWMNETSVFQGEAAEEARTFGIEVFGTGEMITVAWEYVFKDAKRGTTLKISTDDKYFQFTAPGKDFGIKQDLKMKVFNHVLAICYTDSQMSLLAAADGNVGFCSAIARDKQTSKTYLLIEYPPTYTLTVCCKDADGKAVSSASIYLNGSYKGQTDSNGNLAITNVLAGKYTVTAKKCGYEDTSGTITVTGEAALTLTMTRQTYTLIVFCKDSKGKAVSGASVYISGNYQGVTDSRGQLTVPNLTAGTYAITVKKNGYKNTSVNVILSSDKTVTIIMK